MSTAKCYSCASSFGIFNKEFGCKNCGFAFCKKCLTKKTCIPKFGNEKATVCNKCFDILTGKAQPVTIDPPEALAKMAAAQTRHVPYHAQNVAGKSQLQTKALSKEDVALAKRLENLKEDRKSTTSVPSQAEIESRISKLKEEKRLAIPSERDIAGRLAIIRGQDPDKALQPSVLKPEVRKTQQEQVDDLLDEICQEVEIDSHGSTYKGFSGGGNDLNRGDMGSNVRQCATYNIKAKAYEKEKGSGQDENWSEVNRLLQEVANEMEVDAKKAMEDLKKDKDLWERVQKIKAERKAAAADNAHQKQAESQECSIVDSDEDDEKATKKIIQQIMEENCLDEAVGESQFNSQNQGDSRTTTKAGKCRNPDSDDESDELPWCCICNEDAVLRCRGCDGDLYCRRCYKEGHDREDKEDHRTVPYRKK